MTEQLDLFPLEKQIEELKLEVERLKWELSLAQQNPRGFPITSPPPVRFIPGPIRFSDIVGGPPIYGSSELRNGKLEPVRKPASFSDNVGL